MLIDAKPSVRKQIVRELQIMHECNSSYIIECYGSYLADPNICICMEYMDRGSFESIYKKMGPVPIEVVARVAMSVLEGLTYLYDVHRIIHRGQSLCSVCLCVSVCPCVRAQLARNLDIKPSNILCNTQGEIKLCDFGVSGELINSIANTFVGTSIYMSVSPPPYIISQSHTLKPPTKPERIQGAEYSVKSDIWSLGITLVELATGRFPFSDADEPDFATSHTTTTAATAIASQLPDLDEENVMIITAATASMQLNPYADSSSSTPTPTVTNTTHHAPPASHHHHHHRHHTRRKSSGVSLHGGGKTMSIIELMHHIVREPAPRLPEGRFAKAAEEFVDACLEKQVEMRGIPGVLLVSFFSSVSEVMNSTPFFLFF